VGARCGVRGVGGGKGGGSEYGGNKK
jgi:hypothetical protein